MPDPASGRRLTQPSAIAAARLLGAAPYQLLPKVEEVTTVAGHGLVGQLRNGPSIYFGDATQAAAKWAAVLAVLANSDSQGASYIDVTEPQHPAAGSTAVTGAASSGASGGAGAATSAGTTASGASTGTGTPTGGSGTVAGASGPTAAGGSTAAAGAGTAVQTPPSGG